MGALKLVFSTDARTITSRHFRVAAINPAFAINDKPCPPKSVPWWFVSSAKTSSTNLWSASGSAYEFSAILSPDNGKLAISLSPFPGTATILNVPRVQITCSPLNISSAIITTSTFKARLPASTTVAAKSTIFPLKAGFSKLILSHDAVTKWQRPKRVAAINATLSI